MDKRTKVITTVLLIVIIGSIGWHIGKKFIAGIAMAKMMSMPTNVQTVAAETQTIHDSMDYVGRIEAEKEVQIVSRVNGWLQKQYYNDGDFVKKGQLLFQIEPDEYMHAVQNASAAYEQARAGYLNSEKELNRAQQLVKGDYVSRSYYDNAYTKYLTDKANVDAAKAALNTAKLNLSYTKIYSPFDGKIGKAFIDEGNYVTAQTGKIATLVTMNPIYANFTMKKDDLLRFQNSSDTSSLPDAAVTIKFSDGTEYAHEGKLNFMDNMIDKDLGTIMMRAEFKNENAKLIPNDFVRVILTANKEKDVLLIPQAVVLESVNGKYVWVIDEKNTAKQQNIEVAGTYREYWIVKDGLKDGDKVISSNLQSMRQGTKVKETELSDEEKAKKIQAKKDALEYSMTEKPNQKKKNDGAE